MSAILSCQFNPKAKRCSLSTPLLCMLNCLLCSSAALGSTHIKKLEWTGKYFLYNMLGFYLCIIFAVFLKHCNAVKKTAL